MIATWFSGNPRNVGIHVGKSGLLVIDEDEPGAFARYAADHGVTIPDTFTVATGHGKHYYFQDTQAGALGNAEGAFGDYPINVRSGEAYVVGPGSVHESGMVYTADATFRPALLPQWVVDGINGKPNGHKTTNADGFLWEDVGGFEPYELPEVIKEHHRDTALFKFACSMRTQGLNRQLAKVVMRTAWERCEQPPKASHEYTWEEALAKIDNAYDNYEAGRSEEYQKRDDKADTAAESNRTAAAARRIRLTPASSIKPRPVRWAWEDRIPAGELTLTPGRGGIGKSTFHAWIIANLTRGTLPGGHFGTPKPCIIAASEDSWDRTIVPRLIAAGADMDLVFRVDVVTETNEVASISLPRDVDRLTEEITRIGAALLSVDPVMSVLSSALNSHKDHEVRLGLEPLGRLADRTGCVVLGNAHFNKSTGNDPLSLIMGSAAFGNVARAALGFARDTDAEDGSVVISQVKNNLGRLDLPSLRYRIDSATIDTEEGPAEVGKLVMLGESDRSVHDILRERSNSDDHDERREIADWLIDYLTSAGGEAAAADVFKAGKDQGYSVDSLKRAKGKGVKSAKTGMSGGWVWQIVPDEGSTEEREERRFSSPAPFAPFALPSDSSDGPVDNCPVCAKPIDLPNLFCSASAYHGAMS